MKSWVALNEEHCRICGTTVDTSILLDKRMRERFDSYTPLHTLSNKLCSDCSEKSKEYIALVVIKNASYKQTLKQEEAERTGEIVWLKKEVFKRIFNQGIHTEFVFIDNEVKQQLVQMQNQAEA